MSAPSTPVQSGSDLSGSDILPADSPQDPILKPGSYIETPDQPEHESPDEPNNESPDQPDDETLDTGVHHEAETPIAAEGAIENENTAGTETTNEPVTPASSNSKPRKRATVDTSFLPPGWRIEPKPRENGKRPGIVDKYYIDPVSGRKFRSKNEVLYYLETGKLFKKRNKMEICDGSAKTAEKAESKMQKIDASTKSAEKAEKKRQGTIEAAAKRAEKSENKKKGKNDASSKSAENPEVKKARKSGRKKKAVLMNQIFDFARIPVKVNWVLDDCVNDLWTPFAGDEKVPESIIEEWATVYTTVSSVSDGDKRSP